MEQNRITKLFGIETPIVQGGMVWCSGWRLASSVSNHGGLGLLGAGSMYPDVLRHHIRSMKQATQKPWGVNVPLLYPDIDLLIDILIEEQVKIVFTSAGNPAKYTSRLKQHGVTVAHVIANTKFALKCEDAGVDALVAEGFEAGGHNGREETTTLVLIPQIRKATSLPLLAAGGISGGRAMAAAMVLGADGVQLGSVFAAAAESSAHEAFKKRVMEAVEGDTMLSLKKLSPVRMVKNPFWEQVARAEQQGASEEDLRRLLGRGRSKKGIFEGDLTEGELEIGQCASLIDGVKPVAELMQQIVHDYRLAVHEFTSHHRYQF